MIFVLSLLGMVVFPLWSVGTWKNPPRPNYRIPFLGVHPSFPPAGLMLLGYGCIYIAFDELGLTPFPEPLLYLYGLPGLTLVLLGWLGLLFSLGVPAPKFLIPPKARSWLQEERENRRRRRAERKQRNRSKRS